MAHGAGVRTCAAARSGFPSRTCPRARNTGAGRRTPSVTLCSTPGRSPGSGRSGGFRTAPGMWRRCRRGSRGGADSTGPACAPRRSCCTVSAGRGGGASRRCRRHRPGHLRAPGHAVPRRRRRGGRRRTAGGSAGRHGDGEVDHRRRHRRPPPGGERVLHGGRQRCLHAFPVGRPAKPPHLSRPSPRWRGSPYRQRRGAWLDAAHEAAREGAVTAHVPPASALCRRGRMARPSGGTRDRPHEREAGPVGGRHGRRGPGHRRRGRTHRRDRGHGRRRRPVQCR